MKNTHKRTSNQRWLELGWSSQTAAADYFRRVWNAQITSGAAPGSPLSPVPSHLMWLVQGHPDYAQISAEGFSHFTLQPDGRGNYRFVFVDRSGTEHPFSTNTALTGFTHPLREPHRDDEPFRGMSS